MKPDPDSYPQHSASPTIHPAAICETPHVGLGTRIWAFVHILPGAIIGSDCNICDHVFVEGGVHIGDRVTIKSGVQLWEGVQLANDVFVGPNATFTNDRFPRSKHRPEQYMTTVVETGASIGANATILPGVRIGAQAMVGAGAVVTRDVPPHCIVAGNPARIVDHLDHRGSGALDAPPTSSIAGVEIRYLRSAQDLRGSLVAAEVSQEIPFLPKRVFAVYDVPSSKVRGEHAHRRCEQFLIVPTGQVTVTVDSGHERAEHVLDAPDVGLYLPPRIWAMQHNFSPGSVLLVLASRPYEPDDYIRDYTDFLHLVGLAPP